MYNFINPFYQELESQVRQLGGMFNSHLHLDRVATMADRYWRENHLEVMHSSHISLHYKHSLIHTLHNGPAFEKADLSERVNACLDIMVEVDTRRADTMVDVTADRVGLTALETLQQIKQQRADDIDLRLAAYSPFGFTDDEPEHWDMFAAGVEIADFIGALPEADDTEEYPTHIGFTEHCRRVLELANKYHKEVHVHTDQRNEPTETGTERLIEAVRQYGAPASDTGEPMVWAVHMISPSTYDDARFQRLVDGLLECNIGVICCPSAAIGMRQLRPLMTPTYNSIPRVLELVAQGVTVRLASDNIADICSPSTTPNLIDEVFVLSAALRYYDADVLAKLACGVALSDADRQSISEHLASNEAEIKRVMADINQRQQR